MQTLKFHTPENRLDIKLTAGYGCHHKNIYFHEEYFNTDTFEILFFRKGNGVLILNHESIEIKDNRIIFISPYQTRKWQLDRNNLNFTFLVFQEDFLNDFFADKLFAYKLQYFYQLDTPLLLDASGNDIENAFRVLDEIRAELADPQADSEHLIRSLLYYILLRLNRQYSLAYHLPPEKTGNKYAFRFKRLLEENICDKQRVNDYANQLGISRITLNKAVKDQFNVTPNHLLKQRLLFEIKNLLLYSGMTVTEIAYQLNFPEPNHLMRFFKQHTGITTTQYLESYQNGRIR